MISPLCCYVENLTTEGKTLYSIAYEPSCLCEKKMFNRQKYGCIFVSFKGRIIDIEDAGNLEKENYIQRFKGSISNRRIVVGLKEF